MRKVSRNSPSAKKTPRHLVPFGIGGGRRPLEDLNGRSVQEHGRDAELLHERPETTGREPRRAEHIRAAREPAHHAVAERVDVEHRERSEHRVDGREAHRVGDEAAQPEEVLVGLDAELGHARGAGGVHVSGDVERAAGEPGQVVPAAPGDRAATDDDEAVGGHIAGVEMRDAPGDRAVGLAMQPDDGRRLEVGHHLVEQIGGIGGIDQRWLGACEDERHPRQEVAGRGLADDGHTRPRGDAGCGEAGGGTPRLGNGLRQRHRRVGHAEAGLGAAGRPVEDEPGEVGPQDHAKPS